MSGGEQTGANARRLAGQTDGLPPRRASIVRPISDRVSWDLAGHATIAVTTSADPCYITQQAPFSFFDDQNWIKEGQHFGIINIIFLTYSNLAELIYNYRISNFSKLTNTKWCTDVKIRTYALPASRSRSTHTPLNLLRDPINCQIA